MHAISNTKSIKYMDIHQKLCEWYRLNQRDLPWRKTSDPYKIWLSEIILQQTRVQQGLPYYIDFITHYPKVEDLAAAPEDEVLRHWQGLGYYSRARNLHRTAKIVVQDHGGKFPDTYQGLLSLKGIGPYTAAAIASFAYGLPHAVVDGNVYRVLSRLYNIDTNILDNKARGIFQSLAEASMHPEEAATFNQAIMEFGALQCLAQQPLCEDCPLQDHCLAHAAHCVHERPVRIKKSERKHRYLHYLFFYNREHTWIQQRQGKDIWHHLWEFPLWEEDSLYEWNELIDRHPEISAYFRQDSVFYPGFDCSHQLTHQQLHARFFPIKIEDDSEALSEHFTKITIAELDTYAFSRLSLKFLEKFNF